MWLLEYNHFKKTSVWLPRKSGLQCETAIYGFSFTCERHCDDDDGDDDKEKYVNDVDDDDDDVDDDVDDDDDDDDKDNDDEDG